MRNLDQLQRWMQTVIMNLGGAHHGVASSEARELIDVSPEDVEKVVTRSQALTGLERLEIYNRAYFSRLVECLHEEFPVLLHALGEETFDAFAIDYLQKFPSRSYTLNHLGINFPRYLAQSRPGEKAPGASWPDFLIDLATLELTYNEIFDGPGVEGKPLLDLNQLLTIPPERWPEARLLPVCCLRLQRLRYPVHKYFYAVRKGKNPAYPKPRATLLAITRRRYVLRRFELSRLQYVLLEALMGGEAVGAAIRRTAEAAGAGAGNLASSLREWFQLWTAEGFFQAVELDERECLASPG
jgi:hypothetical protein